MIAVPAAQNTPMVLKYMHEKIGVEFKPELAQAFAVLNDTGEFCAGVVLTNYREHDGEALDIEISVASETSMAWRPHVMKAVFQYVFVQLRCKRCTSVVTKGNDRCRKFLNALGFSLEGNLRMGYDGKRDALIYGLLASECRYIDGGLDG